MTTTGFNTRSIGEERTVREAVDFAVESGIGALELDGRHLWQDHLSRGEIRHMKSQAARHGIQYSIHHPQATFPATHDPERRARHDAEMEGTMRLAHDLGSRVIVLHLGGIDYPGVEAARASEQVRLEAVENAAEFLLRAAPKAEAYGVTIAVENLLNRPGDVTRTYAELADVVRRLDSPVVGITLDTGHAQRTEGIDSAFETFREDLRHLHVHDCVDGVDHHELGRGDLDLARYEEILRARPVLLVLEVGKGAVLALETGQDPRGVVLRSVAAVKRMLGDLAA
jgi:sugar phosphate isomerase/epimerase